MTNNGLTPRRPPPLHSSTINTHQRHLTTETNEDLNDIDSSAGGGLLLRLQRRLKQLEQENKMINEELEKGSSTNSNKFNSLKKNSFWHLDELEMDKLKNDLKALREEVLKGDEKAAKEQLLGWFSLLLFFFIDSSSFSSIRCIKC